MPFVVLTAAGPAFLAVNFLGGLGGLLSPFEAAAAGFGVLLVRTLLCFRSIQ